MSDHQLKDFSTEELETEVERRKNPPRPQPKLVRDMDWTSVVDYLEDAMNGAEAGQIPDEVEHYLFENVMEIVYGTSVWKWWTRKVH